MEDRKNSSAKVAEQALCVCTIGLACPGSTGLIDSCRCQRWHPLICVNQSLLMELKWIRDHHRLASDERRSATYAKAMASIKAYPYAIKNAKEAVKILGVGDKIAAQCGEYAKTGKIHAAGVLRVDRAEITADVSLQRRSSETKGMLRCSSSPRYTVLALPQQESCMTSTTVVHWQMSKRLGSFCLLWASGAHSVRAVRPECGLS